MTDERPLLRDLPTYSLEDWELRLLLYPVLLEMPDRAQHRLVTLALAVWRSDLFDGDMPRETPTRG